VGHVGYQEDTAVIVSRIIVPSLLTGAFIYLCQITPEGPSQQSRTATR